MERKNKKEQIIIKACCAIAAFILWLYIYNVENPIKDRNITVPVKIINQDLLVYSKLAPVIEEDVTLKITIRGNASDIYSVEPGKIELQADLNALALKKGENKVPVVLKSSPDGIKVVNAESLFVNINIDELVVKTVPVKVILEGKAQTGFYAINPELKYKEVKISGPSQTVNLVKYAVARCNVSDSSKDVSFKTNLEAESAGGIKFKYVLVDPDVIDITVPVKKVKTVGINVIFNGNIDSSNTLVKSVLPEINAIEIAGDDEYLNNILNIDTEPIDIKTLNGAQTIDTNFVVPKGVTIVNNVSSVKLNVTYNKAAEKIFSLPVKTNNLSSNLSAVMNNSTVSISVSGPEALIKNLTSNNFDCYVDLNNIGEGTHDVQVNVKLPEGISKTSINPSSISVTLKNKDSGGQ